MYTAESSPAWSISSGSGILNAAGIQVQNFKYVLKSKLTNFFIIGPELLGLALMPFLYHFGKYTLSLRGWSLKNAKARRNANADKRLMAAEVEISWTLAIFLCDDYLSPVISKKLTLMFSKSNRLRKQNQADK